MEVLQFLLMPFLASLILTGIHAYLGVHVVERGVIFVDLALAQIAALGATVAILLGMDPHGRSSYWISLGFTFLGAGIFSVLRMRRVRIPQEAIIGIAYAVASAAAILAMSKATGETEHLKDMLVGNILAVSAPEVGRTALLYGAIGLFHYFFRKKFLLISIDPRAAEAQGVSVRFWDFLFYASFGFVVTSSVAIAGVLLVFCYLIVPSVGAMLFADRIGRRLAIGWTMGTLVSALGVYLSVFLDLPTGATIVCTFGGVLALMFLAHYFVFRRRRAEEAQPGYSRVALEGDGVNDQEPKHSTQISCGATALPARRVFDEAGRRSQPPRGPDRPAGARGGSPAGGRCRKQAGSTSIPPEIDFEHAAWLECLQAREWPAVVHTERSSPSWSRG
jgi:zinc/manganese transport system permease protein